MYGIEIDVVRWFWEPDRPLAGLNRCRKRPRAKLQQTVHRFRAKCEPVSKSLFQIFLSHNMAANVIFALCSNGGGRVLLPRHRSQAMLEHRRGLTAGKHRIQVAFCQSSFYISRWFSLYFFLAPTWHDKRRFRLTAVWVLSPIKGALIWARGFHSNLNQAERKHIASHIERCLNIRMMNFVRQRCQDRVQGYLIRNK